MSDVLIDRPELCELGQYEFGWSDSDAAGASARRGLSSEVVARHLGAEERARVDAEDRAQGLRSCSSRKPMPTWGADLSGIDFDNI